MEEKLAFGVSDQTDPNWAVQPQKIARGLNFRIEEVGGGLHYVAKTKTLISGGSAVYEKSRLFHYPARLLKC